MQPSAPDDVATSTRTGILTRTRSPHRCSSPFRKYDMKRLLAMDAAAIVSLPATLVNREEVVVP
jgi:hypothetical protein